MFAKDARAQALELWRSEVCSFDRLVTQRVHALDDRVLARDRPLGEARILWEFRAAGCDVCDLRSRLDLDSGYLSRLLWSLERAGLVTVARGVGPTGACGSRA
jgi:DNA-binding MarR family transcriptional regulator